MIDFSSSTFCNAGVLEFTAGSAELCRDREPGIAAVAGGSFWSQSSNIAEKKIKELLLGVRYQQELLFFFVFHNGSRHSADDQYRDGTVTGLFRGVSFPLG